MNGPKKPCPNRCPVELSDGLKFKPDDILPKLGITAVSPKVKILLNWEGSFFFFEWIDFLKGSLNQFLKPNFFRV